MELPTIHTYPWVTTVARDLLDRIAELERECDAQAKMVEENYQRAEELERERESWELRVASAIEEMEEQADRAEKAERELSSERALRLKQHKELCDQDRDRNRLERELAEARAERDELLCDVAQLKDTDCSLRGRLTQVESELVRQARVDAQKIAAARREALEEACETAREHLHAPHRSNPQAVFEELDAALRLARGEHED